jgi:hypothetical protein
LHTGDQATIAMILYANMNHVSLRAEYPTWPDRIKQIAKIWKNLPNEKRVPYVARARENRTASRINRPVVSCRTTFASLSFPLPSLSLLVSIPVKSYAC